MTARPLYIYGAGELASLAFRYASGVSDFKAFVVDPEFRSSSSLLEQPVIDWTRFIQEVDPADADLFVAIGYRSFRARRSAFERACEAGFRCTNIVHDRSFVADGVTLGSNTIVMPGAVIEPGTRLGDNNVVWSNATVCHDCRLGSHNFLAANATLGGGVSVGDQNFFGFSSVVIQGRSVGSENIVGAMALLLEDVRDFGRYLGVPARNAGQIDPSRGVEIE